jgi:hypothetical protein
MIQPFANKRGFSANPRLTLALRLNVSIGTIYDWKEAGGEGAGRGARGRVRL